MDTCEDADALRKERRELAVAATADALRAVFAPGERAEKLEAVDQVLAHYLSFDDAAECAFDNNWCDAPERQYENSSCACRAAGLPAPHTTPAAFGAAALAFGTLLRRRRGKHIR